VAATATGVLGTGFAAVAILIIGAAVRLAIFARRQEIAIMQLVGATNWFIRKPFLLEGLITGLGGGILAAIATWLSYSVLTNSVFTVVWIPGSWVVAGVLAGGALGVIASWIAVHRHLQLA